MSDTFCESEGVLFYIYEEGGMHKTPPRYIPAYSASHILRATGTRLAVEERDGIKKSNGFCTSHGLVIVFMSSHH